MKFKLYQKTTKKLENQQLIFIIQKRKKIIIKTIMLGGKREILKYIKLKNYMQKYQ